MTRSKIIVIGGGASGIIASIIAARNGAKVTLIERKERIGKKILATGNGQCNISNQSTKTECFHSSCKCDHVLQSTFNKFSVSDTIDFFETLGITIVEKENGKLYPRSLQANSVLNALLLELERLKIDVITNAEVNAIHIDNNIKVSTQKKNYYGNRLIIAAGGKSNKDLGSNGSGFVLAKNLGHTIIEPIPSLVQIETDFSYLKHLQGTKIDGDISILDQKNKVLRKETGEILFANYGLSGPPVLQISRIAAKRLYDQLNTHIEIDLVPEFTKEALDHYLIKRLSLLSYKTAEESLNGFLNNRLIVPLLKENTIDLHKKAGDITKIERNQLVDCMKGLKMQVIGTRQWNQSQVTAGGISLDEIDDNLQSKKIEHVYFCGEVLDVDGDCGGYNLQWAWSSGAVVGLHASK